MPSTTSHALAPGLTLVHVRGQKRPRSRGTPSNASSAPSTRFSSPHKRARLADPSALDVTSETNASTSTVNSNIPSNFGRPLQPPTSAPSRPRHSYHKFSPLELLPVEILTHIFFLADYSIFLPRSSHYIGIKLSPTRALKDRVLDKILNGFQHRAEHDRWHHYSVDEGITLPESSMTAAFTVLAGSNPLFLDWKACQARQQMLKRSRSALLGCRWVTLEVIHQATFRVVAQEKQRLDDLKAHAQAADLARLRKLNVQHHGELVRLRLDCHIPQKLLKWPIQNADRCFLDFLVATWCIVDSHSTLDLETATDTLLEAIKHKDYRLIHRFMSKGIHCQPGLIDLEAALEMIHWDSYALKLIHLCLQDWPRRGSKDVPTGIRKLKTAVNAWTAARYPKGTEGRAIFTTWTLKNTVVAWGGFPCRHWMSADAAQWCSWRKSGDAAIWHDSSDLDGVDLDRVYLDYVFFPMKPYAETPYYDIIMAPSGLSTIH